MDKAATDLSLHHACYSLVTREQGRLDLCSARVFHWTNDARELDRSKRLSIALLRPSNVQIASAKGKNALAAQQCCAKGKLTSRILTSFF